MEDQSIFRNSHPGAISEGLQRFIDSMVEEIVITGKPFESQKKYLRKFSENEGLDYEKLEDDINAFIMVLESLRTAFSKVQVQLAEEKGRECHISEETLQKLVSHSSQPTRRKAESPATEVKTGSEKKPNVKYVLYGFLGLFVAALVLFMVSRFRPGPKPAPVIVVTHDTVTVDRVQVKHDTVIKVQYGTEAERKYREAAEQGDANAQFNLGYNYSAGEKGLPQNYAEAVQWYTKAANQGHAAAQNNLGLCYEKGNGVKQDYAKAIEWYKKALGNGSPKAQSNLDRVEKLMAASKAPRVIEWTIAAPSWSGKTLSGDSKDKFKLREVRRTDNPGRWTSWDNSEWLDEENIQMGYSSYTKNPEGVFEGSKKAVDLSVFPFEYNGAQLKRYEFRDDYYSASYADSHWDYKYIMLHDTRQNVLYVLDFSAFSKAPYTKPGDEDFVTQGVRYPQLIGNVLYVQHGHGTYANSSGNKNAYISAIDLKTGQILWTTQPLTCNSDFTIIDNTIICGYGFSAEPDYIYLVDMATGKRRQTLKIASAADYIVRKDNQVFVLAYGEHYDFEIVK